MSVYSVNYQKLTDGYNKIMNTINSVEVVEQLECISNMVDSWLALAEKWCEQTYKDKENKTRKKDADHLAEVCQQMFEDLKEVYQERIQALQPEPYEGRFKPCRVKSLQEMVHEDDVQPTYIEYVDEEEDEE